MADNANDEKIWATTNSNVTHHHAFVMRDGELRAMCRTNIRPVDGMTEDLLYSKRHRMGQLMLTGTFCDRCYDKVAAMVDRRNASMEPAQERHDAGYVAPVDDHEETPTQERHDADYTVAVQMAESDVVRGEWYRISDWAKSRPEYPGRQNSDRVVQAVAIVYRESRPPHVAFDIPQVDRRNNLRWAHSALPMSDFRRIYQPVGSKHVSNEENQQ